MRSEFLLLVKEQSKQLNGKGEGSSGVYISAPLCPFDFQNFDGPLDVGVMGLSKARK